MRHEEDEDDREQQLRPRRRDEYEDEPPRRDSARRRPPSDEYEYDAPRKPARSSVLGIISLVIGLLTGLVMFILVALAGVMAARAGGNIDEHSPLAMVVGLGICGGMLVAVLGLILGVIGVAVDGNKLFGGLGLALNFLILLGVVGLMIIGTMAR